MVRGTLVRNQRLEVARSEWTNLYSNETEVVPRAASVSEELRTLAARLNVPQRMVLCNPDVAPGYFFIGVGGDKEPGFFSNELSVVGPSLQYLR